MKNILLFCLIFNSLTSYTAEIYEEGIVISSFPIYKATNKPYLICETYIEKNQNEKTATGALLGGLAGWLIGNSLGTGNGKLAMGIFGAGGGAIIGDKIEDKYLTEYKKTEKCSEINRNESVVNGFLTKFRFKNKESELVTSNQYRKGDKIFIGIND